MISNELSKGIKKFAIRYKNDLGKFPAKFAMWQQEDFILLNKFVKANSKKDKC